jgi:Uma2 family endonuclease
MTPESAIPASAAHPARELPVFPTNLPETDGEPLDSDWHRLAMNLLLAVLWYHFRDRRDFFAGGNMFLYFSTEQLRNQDFRGPDVFFVWDVERDRKRKYWAVWEEGGKYPNLIIELLSPSTAHEDRTTKKTVYEQVFKTREYFLYDPDTQQLEGYRLRSNNGGKFAYEPIEREEDGRLWSTVLELYLGTWEGPYRETEWTWLRFFDVRGRLVLLEEEDQRRLVTLAEQRADEEKRRADEEKRRADEMEVRTRRAALLDFLQARLEDPVPDEVRRVIEAANDPATLQRWFQTALRAGTMTEFRNSLQQQP